MKFAITLLGFAMAVAAMPSDASPNPGGLFRRQNDLPPCEDGQDPPFESWNNESDCEKDCWMKEGAKNDNYKGVCTGYCSTTTPGPPGGPGNAPIPVVVCSGKDSS